MSEANQARCSLARGGIVGFVGATTSVVLDPALTIVLSRVLGTEGVDIVTRVTDVFVIVIALVKMGLDSTTTYLMPHLSLDVPEEIRTTLSFMTFMTVGVPTVCIPVLEAVAPLTWNAEVAAFARAILWFVPIDTLTLVVFTALRTSGNMHEYVLIQNLLLPGLRPFLAVLATTFTGPLAFVSVARALPFVVVHIVAWWLLSRYMPSTADSVDH